MRQEKLQVGLDWEARPIHDLLRLAWPIAVSMLSYSVMTLVDILFVGRLGTGALAGVGLGGTVAFTVLCFSIGLLRSVKVLVSQAVGAGKREHCHAYLGAGLMSAAVLGLCTLLVGQAVATVLPGIAASPEAGASAHSYFAIRILGAPLALIYVALREARYGVGDSRTPMRASLAGNATNIGLDYLFILVLDYGVAGAAWASVIGQGVEALLLCRAQRPEGFGLRVVATRHVLAVLRVGLPTGLQFVLEVGSFALLAALLSALSELEMAAHQIGLQVVHFSFLPAFALSEAASVQTGQAVGAGRDELVKAIGRRSLAVASTYMGLCALGMVFGGELIAHGFSHEPMLVRRTVELLWVAAAFQLFDGANMVARGVLRGTGDVRYPALIGIVTAWLFTPPLTWLLGYHIGLGALGGWLGLCAEICVGAGLLWWRLECGGWRGAAARSRAELEQGSTTGPLVAALQTEG